MSDESSEIGNRCMFQLVKQMLISKYFKKEVLILVDFLKRSRRKRVRNLSDLSIQKGTEFGAIVARMNSTNSTNSRNRSYILT